MLNRIREVRGGRLNSSEFGKRMTGEGEYWKMIEQVFRLHARRLGFNQQPHGRETRPRPTTFRRPSPQQSLFD